MIKSVIKISAVAALLVGTSAIAETGNDPDTYEAGDTVLTITRDGYKIEARSPLVNPGNSTRLYFRPRNGNCTSPAEFYDMQKKSLKVNNDPGCLEDKWGYVSIDVPSKEKLMSDSDKKIEIGARIAGMKKDYDAGVVVTLTPTGDVVLAGIGTK